jgi:uncharacterized membrane protein YbhN (UPF0104 family)
MTLDKPRAKRWWWTLFSEALFVVAAYFLVMQLVRDWGRLAPDLRHVSREYLVLTLVPTFVMLVLMAVGWTLAMRGAGASMSWRVGFGIYYRSSIFRYLPGSLWYLPGRGYFCQQWGIPLSVFLSGALVELAYLLSTGGIWAGLISFMRPELAWMAGISILCILVTVVMTAWPNLFNLFSHLARRPTWLVRFDRRILFQLVFVYIAVWFFYGLSLYLSIASLVQVAWISLPYVLFSNTAAWALGFMSFVPTGLGVREATLVFLFRNILTPGDIIVASLIQRVVELVIEGVFWAFSRYILR